MFELGPPCLDPEISLGMTSGIEENIPDSKTQLARVKEAVQSIRGITTLKPRIGLILGSGLGGISTKMEVQYRIPYESIPHFPVSTLEFHEGDLLLGTLEGVPVVCMKGRAHIYEGYNARQVTFPTRVMKNLGIESLFIFGACGGMNPAYRRGDFMLFSDHINLQGVNPLIGPNVSAWGPRFPDMTEPYDLELRRFAKQIAKNHSIPLHEGVYVSVLGPNRETRAEYRFLRKIGADVVGMSTTPEVIVARHMDIRVMAIGVITDECSPDALQPVTVKEVLGVAASVEPKLASILSGVVGRLVGG